MKYNAYLNPIISLILGKDTETGARHKKGLENYVVFGLYNIYLQNKKKKNETVKEGGLVLKIMHTPETNLLEKMAASLRSLDNFLQEVLFQDFFVLLEGLKSLEN